MCSIAHSSHLIHACNHLILKLSHSCSETMLSSCRTARMWRSAPLRIQWRKLPHCQITHLICSCRHSTRLSYSIAFRVESKLWTDRFSVYVQSCSRAWHPVCLVSVERGCSANVSLTLIFISFWAFCLYFVEREE